jgi:serine/threonine-protein kinase RsbT
MRTEIRIPIRSEPDVAGSVLRSGAFARKLGFDEVTAQMIATAVSELATNIVRYGERGEIRLKAIDSPAGIELAAIDRGPGIADTELAMTEHYSSQRSLGLGLSGVKRMMDQFEIESELGVGTRVVGRKWL